MAHDVILTGVPRSGTTLTCRLLNTLPDTVALVEPMDVSQFARLADRGEVAALVQRFFDDMRRSIATEGSAVSMQVGGRIPDNTVADRRSASGLRTSVISRSVISVDKEVGPEFTLVLKHPSAFTAALDVLARTHPCYAVVRNPLSVLASWSSVALGLQDGHVPAAENMDRRLKDAVAAIPERIDRQLFILNWFYQRYADVLPLAQVIRYEDIIASRGAALAVITPRAADLCEPLQSRNRNDLYPEDLMQRLAERLLRRDGAFWGFYTKDDVRALVA